MPTPSPLAALTPHLARVQLLVPVNLPAGLAADVARDWQAEGARPSGFEELLPHFQRLMQPDDAAATSVCWGRHRLGSEALASIAARLSLGTHGGTPLLAPALQAADLTLTPSGDGLLALHLAYPASATLDEVADSFTTLRRATTARLPHDPIWTLASPADGHRLAMEPWLPPADDSGQRRLSLQALAGALVGLTPAAALVDVARGGFAYGHASVTLEAHPGADALEDALSRLARGVPTSFDRPPADALGVRTLAPRGNRRVAVAREAVAAISWPSGGETAHDELRWATDRFHGIYRLLHFHVHAERMAIASFSDRAARLAGALDPDALLAQQHAISALLVEITAYTLTLTGEECGGNGDHVAVFRALRQAHLIASQRDELRAEIDELRALLRAVDNARDQLAADAERQASKEERDFQRRISLLAFFITPLAVVTGVLGVNVDVGDGEPMLFPLGAALWVLAGAYGLSALFLGGSLRRR